MCFGDRSFLFANLGANLSRSEETCQLKCIRKFQLEIALSRIRLEIRRILIFYQCIYERHRQNRCESIPDNWWDELWKSRVLVCKLIIPRTNDIGDNQRNSQDASRMGKGTAKEERREGREEGRGDTRERFRRWKRERERGAY